MKIDLFSPKNLKIATFLAVSLLVVSATNSQTKAQTLIETETAVGIGTSIDKAPAVNPTTIRERIRTDLENKSQNIKNNQNIRTNLAEKRVNGSVATSSVGSTTPPMRKGEPQENKNEFRKNLGTTSPRFGTSTASSTIGRNNKPFFDFFKERKAFVANQFEVAIRNLANIQERISTRINKEKQNGRDMTKASQLLTVANTKISLAKDAVSNLKNYSLATSTASSTIDVGKTRELITNTQKTIKDARSALNDVIVAIAHAMGLKIGNNKVNTASTTSATTTATTTTTTTPAATTTSTTTNL